MSKRLQSRPESIDMPLMEVPYRSALVMAECLAGRPRYPKMHPCGIILPRQPMRELTPCFISRKNYPTSHLDMDAAEAIGLVKMDILAQSGLAVMRDACRSLAAEDMKVDVEALEPWDDPEVWRMIAQGGSRAVHHIESPAMTNLCGMTAVEEIGGRIAIVSVIRPGAAHAAKKLRFTRKYQGFEPVEYPHPSLEPCLRTSYGLVVYEEHILQICVDFADMPPGCVNDPGPAFTPGRGTIRIPVSAVKGLSAATLGALLASLRKDGKFQSVGVCFDRVSPSSDELESLIRAGAFDDLGLSRRTRQFREAQACLRRSREGSGKTGQWLLPPPNLEAMASAPLQEPSSLECLRAEMNLFGFTVSGHPPELYPDIAWETYCPVSSLRGYVGQDVVMCGLVVVTRIHSQEDGGPPLLFLTLADRTGMVEAELFADVYRRHGLATVRYPVLEIHARVEPFENGKGFSLRVHRAGKPRSPSRSGGQG